MPKPFNRAIKLAGEAAKIGTYFVTVLEYDANNLVVRAKGASVPAAGDAGFAFNCRFVDTTNSIEYINRGTSSSALFLVSSKDAVETVVATNAITATESGKVFFLSASTEFVSTLPAPAAGLHFTFIVTAAPSGAAYTVVTNGSANIIKGTVHSSTGGNADSETSGADTVTFADGAAVAGDMAEFWCDGTNWFVKAFCDADAGITFDTAS
jgi:hypothetical protein